MNAITKLNFHRGFEYVLGFDYQSFSAQDDVWRIADLDEEVKAAYAQVRTTPDLLEKTSISVEARYNTATNVDGSTVWNVSAKHSFNDSLYLRATVGTSFRLPDAEELFLNEFYDDDADGVPDGGWFAVGNTDLKPEQNRNYNLALDGSFGNLSYEIIGFTRDIDDYIQAYVPVYIEGVEGESFVNSDDEVNVEGFEIITSLAISEDWRADLSYIDTRAELNNDGTQLTGIPESEAKFRLDYNPVGHSFGASFAVNHVSDINARRGVERGNYTVMDLSGYYQFGANKAYRLGLRVENLSDEEYATRVDKGTEDSTGSSYLYDSLGMSRTLHVNYSYQF